jgi:hypothetical protein
MQVFDSLGEECFLRSKVVKIAGGGFSHHVCQQPPVALAADARASIGEESRARTERIAMRKGVGHVRSRRATPPLPFIPLSTSSTVRCIGSDYLRRHACVVICMCTATEPRQGQGGRILTSVMASV